MVDLHRIHGGPDAHGVLRHDFSSNGHAMGPCPVALSGVRQADASRYPDPSYARLREQLAQHHGVAPARIVIAASGSEFIQRITAWAARSGVQQVCVPTHGYGDYGAAARAWALNVALHEQAEASDTNPPALAWFCEPSSPHGASPRAAADRARAGLHRPHVTQVLDRAYEPLRLSGASAFDATFQDHLWQLWTPNKALGLTGVRGAYAIAPRSAGDDIVHVLESFAPSWPLGAHGVALLQAWCDPDVQHWLEASRSVLRGWKLLLLDRLHAMGWQPLPGDASFVCARLPCAPDEMPALLQALRTRHGLKLRDCASFGLPGHVRVAVLPPPALDALRDAWRDVADPGAYSAPP